MKNFVYATEFADPTIDSVTSEQILLFPSTRVLDDLHPKRPWKSTDTTQQDIVFNFGASMTVSVFLNRVNYGLVQFFGDDVDGTNAITPSASAFSYGTSGGSFVVPVDERVGRRKALYQFTAPMTYFRLRIPGSQTTDDGQAAYSTGAISFPTNLVELAGGHQFPLNMGAPTGYLQADFGDLGAEYVVLGDPRYEVGFRGAYDATQQEAPFLSFMRLAPGQPVLYAENTWAPGQSQATPPVGRPEHAYLVRIQTAIRPSYLLPEVFEVEMQVAEIV